jgi:hypothetical protein
MKTLLGLAMIVAVAGLLWHLNQESRGRAEALQNVQIQRETLQNESHSVAIATSTPFVPSSIPPRNLSDLYLIRGVIIEAGPDGVIMQCEQVIHPNMTGWSLPAYSGNADSAAMARWATGDFDGRYGQPIQVINGRWTHADFAPSRMAAGIVLLTGAPDQASAEVGKRLKIVAAPTGDLYRGRISVFAASFPLTAEASKAWMWGNRNALDRSGYSGAGH